MQPRWVSGDAECVDDEALFALARGELGHAELARVEAHLRDCSDCRAVLGEASRSLAPDDDTHEGQRTLSCIGRYEIQALIGAGASGVVYRAFDPKLQRTVAIKVLRPEQHDAPELSARMLREAQAMARLSAPTVVAVFDAGIEDGAVYLVMEYVHGSTLAAWLGAEERSVADILTVFAEAGRGLSAAHEKGLVHRDFKPENVLVAQDGGARVTDFGLAREAESQAVSGLEPHGVVQLYAPTRGLVGTPAYIAPELFAGERATAKSDQFAFCVALFAALFGQHPFAAGDRLTLAQLSERTRQHAMVSPLVLGIREPRRQRLYTVLERGLRSDPAERFADMDELLSALAAASRPRLTLGVVSGLAAALALLALVLSVRGFRSEPLELVQPAPATSAPAAAPVRQASANDAAAEPAERAPAAATAPSPSEPANNAKAKRRARKKSGDVRYRDWLKDPF